jgi:mannose-6-phosphate isomerase-like protein (cupin superfamily)
MERFKNTVELRQFSPDKMKKNGLFETSRFFCDVYCLEPGQAQAPHGHEGSDKVYYVIEGRARFEIAAENKELGAGEAALAVAGERHGVANPGPDRLVLLVFMAPKPHHRDVI